jgi:hypothetical protein
MKALKIGCLSILGLFVLLALYFIFEPESWKKERLNKAQSYVDSVVYRMIVVNDSLPDLNEVSIPRAFPAGAIDWSVTLQTSVEQVHLLAKKESPYAKPLQYGPWLTQLLADVAASSDTTQGRDEFKLIGSGEKIMKMKYLVVYQPLYYAPPKVVNKKTFLPGYFDGWMIYVDFKTGRILGYADFQSVTTLARVDTKNLGVGVGPLTLPLINTTDVQGELDKDFRNEFFRKSDSTFMANK